MILFRHKYGVSDFLSEVMLPSVHDVIHDRFGAVVCHLCHLYNIIIKKSFECSKPAGSNSCAYCQRSIIVDHYNMLSYHDEISTYISLHI